jgi:hypothetical protein
MHHGSITIHRQQRCLMSVLTGFRVPSAHSPLQFGRFGGGVGCSDVRCGEVRWGSRSSIALSCIVEHMLILVLSSYTFLLIEASLPHNDRTTL